jgi:hypothetical protein
MRWSIRTTTAVLAAAGLALAACGTSDDAAPATDAGVTVAPATEPASAASEAEPVAPIDSAAPVAPTESTPTEPGDPSAAEPAPEVPVVTEAAAPAEAVVGGRAFASELSAASDFSENVLPDIQVDDVGREMKVNLRNVFPAERPVLFWLWAPH